MPNHILIYGNPSDGFNHVGPFADAADAVKHAEDHCRSENWWVHPLTSPQEDADAV